MTRSGDAERPTARLRPAAFLDRDGTVIRDPGYLSDPRDVELLSGAVQALLLLKAAGLPVILITNQSGIGRGLYAEADFWRVQRRLESLLHERGADIDGVYFCPHDPVREACECRKPALGLYRRAAREHGLDLARSIFVGDRLRDVLPAARTGGTGVLVLGSERSYDERVPAWCVVSRDLPTGIRQALGRTGSSFRPPKGKGSG